jgi:predicted Fe-Mo cluster-binding NifX family protein
MKICVSAVSNNLEAPIDPRFGRCPYFVIVDSETMQFEAVPNVASGATGGAGIQAAQTIASKGAKVLITGNVGPNAFQALSAAGIKIVIGASGTVREFVEKYKKGELTETDSPTVGGHFGMGGGRGRRRGQWGT